MIGRLNHVAIAVPDLAAASAQYRDALGAKVGEPQAEPDHGVTVVFVELPNTKSWLPRARGFWGMANRKLALTKSRCCSCTPRTSTER